MNPFATTAATARGCSINYEPRAFTRLPTYPANYHNFLSFVAKDGVLKFNKHLPFHRGSDAGRLPTHRGGDCCSESDVSGSYNRDNSHSKVVLISDTPYSGNFHCTFPSSTAVRLPILGKRWLGSNRL